MLLGNIINGEEDVEIRGATAAATAAAAAAAISGYGIIFNVFANTSSI